jgi:hypothetical protein
MRLSRTILPVLAVSVVVACDDRPTHVFVEFPSFEQLTGTFVGTGEITNDTDISWNPTYGQAGGFAFPVVIQFDGLNRTFVLRTANFSTSFNNEEDRICAGIFTKDSNTIEFFPNQLCRALPLTKFTIGRTLPDGLNLDARTGPAINQSQSFVDMRVRYVLRTQ